MLPEKNLVSEWSVSLEIYGGWKEGGGSGLSSKFVVPSEAEPVLSQSDLRYSVSLSLVGKTEISQG